jgi:acetylornithine deacetylase/succinyl-diaminopimelate desuccinylase-like protein
MAVDHLEAETTEVLQRLVRFNTVNPPGNERPALEYLSEYVQAAGFETQMLGAQPDRPNLIADLHGEQAGPTLCFLGHVDTVLADASEWDHDPWSGDVADGALWGRGALDMKSQVAAEAVAAAALAQTGWRPQRGHLKLVFVSDEETGGELGAQWLTREHPDQVRCDLLLNEGAGQVFPFEESRRYGVCCGEKGVFRFTLTARGTAGHASIPRMGDNALLKLGPVLEKLSGGPPSFLSTEAPEAFMMGLGFDAKDPAGTLARLNEIAPGLAMFLESMLGVTLTPTMAHASDKVNVIPSRASLKVDCRVPPGHGEDAARERINQVLGETAGELDLSFNETVSGNASPVETEFMGAIDGWIKHNDSGAATVPVILPGFSDSRWFRDAFPECVAYGFFPQRHQSLAEAAPLVHSANERIDVRDLGFAAKFYSDIAREMLG